MKEEESVNQRGDKRQRDCILHTPAQGGEINNQKAHQVKDGVSSGGKIEGDRHEDHIGHENRHAPAFELKFGTGGPGEQCIGDGVENE